jgi:hypothetical protein
MLGYSDDDIKNAAEIREWLTKQILEKQYEIEKIKITLSLIDSVLKKGSFQTAANLNSTKSDMSQNKKTREQSSSKAFRDIPSKHADEVAQKEINKSTVVDVKPIKRLKDNTLVAEVHVFANSMEIIPEKNIKISLETPPFRSFFLNRILQGMKNKDLEKIKQGSLTEAEMISFEVVTDESNGENIKKVIINNFREKERVNEIFNTAAWVITRMLEKGER